MSVKKSVLALINKMPSGCTWDEVLYQIYARRQIEAGLRDEAAGRLVPHEKVFAKYVKKKKKARVDRKSRKGP
jgi:hypothetical protein